MRKVSEIIRGDPTERQSAVRIIAVSVGAGVAFFLAAYLGLALLTTAERVAMFWPASGVAAGTLIALGPWARPPVAAGVLVATVAANVMGDRSLWAALAFGLCNAGEALMVAWLIERWFGPVFNLDRLRRVLGLFAAAAIAAVSAALGASTAMKVFGPSTAEFLDVWKVWSVSAALGVVTVAPLLIGIAAIMREMPPWREILEGLLVVVVVAVTTAITFTLFTGSWSLIAPSGVLFPLLLWLGYRCRPVFAAAAVFTVAAIIVGTTITEFGRYGDPAQPIAIRVAAAQVVMVGFTLTALALAALFAERKRAEEQLRLLVAELDHRVKNTLATVSAVTSRTLDASSSPGDFVAAIDRRIKSMAETHQLLSSHRWKGILLADLVHRELAPYAAGGNIEIGGSDIMLKAEAAQAVSMVLHELTTNAAKHGALSTREGRVSVRWYRVLNGDAGVRIEWQESDGPAVQAPERSGYGVEVIRGLLPYELDGEVDLAFAAEGVRCRFDIPVSQLTSGDDQGHVFGFADQ